MVHRSVDADSRKDWLAGPWDNTAPVPVGYANSAIDEPHYHAEMHEIYLVARGKSTAVVSGNRVELAVGEVLVVEPGEIHTFVNCSDDYLHFVVHAPFVEGDKHEA